MSETIYVKYNGTRQKAFQIKTAIRMEQGEKAVDKTALCPEGEAHIRSFEEKYRLLSEESGRLTFLKPEIRDGGRTARFAFLTGDTLSKRVGETISQAAGETEENKREAVKEAVKEALETAVSCRPEYVSDFTVTQEFLDVFGQAAGETEENKREAVKEAVKEALETAVSCRPEYVSDFTVTQEFLDVFGQSETPEQVKEDFLEKQKKVFEEAFGKGERSFRTANADALFDNIMMCRNPEYQEGGEEPKELPIALDYEWVFQFPIPVSFLQYRILFYFYEDHRPLLVDLFPDRASFLTEFSLNEKLFPVYEAMENSFQNYVHGENQRILQGNYYVPTKTMKELRQSAQEMERAKDRISQLKAEAAEKDIALRKAQEVQRLTNNHVANLENMIGDLRREIGEMGKTLSYLNRHEALIFKARRKAGQAFNKAVPRGTVQRKKLGYVKNTVLHPASSLKLYTTDEGKNRIKGHFEIGDEYLTYGKLVFPKEENPMVSIVIPVYNQIHYTYLCLASILEHTKDVSYEIIIADDVSTDATEHLSEFAENLVIRRNQTNQGFLKNCNQAAEAARGKYVMFLNNDTQVTEGWLSSLVNLIESDDTIGMVGSKLVYPDGRLQEAGGIIWSDGSGWNYGRLDDPDKAEYNYVKDVDYISGAAILLSVKLWKQIGGFDERFAPAYCEDSDLAFEVRKAGYRVVYQPLSKVIHFEGISNGTDVNGSGLKRYQVENSEKLKEKWAEEFKKQCVNTGNPNPFRARERSQGKKIILVVDHYVPTFDRDAGSKTTFQYLKMFLKKGYVVKFLGDNYLHEEPYSTTLQQMGIEILYGQEYVTGIWDWLDKNGNEITAAYLNRPHIATKYVDYIADHTNMKIIFYGHDLHFLREFREYELTGDPAKKRDSDYWKSIEFTLMHKAAASYYPSEVEIEAIHEIDDTVKAKAITAYVYEDFLDNLIEFTLMHKAAASYYPSEVEIEAIHEIDDTVKAKAITAYVYEDFLDNLNLDFEKREGLLFVGGFAHPPNADAVLWFANEVFPLIRKKLNVNFYIVGSKVTEEIKALEQPGNGIIVKGFVSEEELSELYRTCRLVVVPLRYGAGVKGKVVEAIYNGAPIVTTSVGSEGIPGVEDVLLVEDQPEAFADTVVKTYSDTEKLVELSKKTQSYIRDHFSIDAAWEVIREDFEG